MNYTQLTYEQRYQICALVKAGHNQSSRVEGVSFAGASERSADIFIGHVYDYDRDVQMHVSYFAANRQIKDGTAVAI